MLIICDFLLLSMLALARFDPPEEVPTVTLDATASSETAEAELISLLEESLKSELSSRQNLTERGAKPLLPPHNPGLKPPLQKPMNLKKLKPKSKPSKHPS